MRPSTLAMAVASVVLSVASAIMLTTQYLEESVYDRLSGEVGDSSYDDRVATLARSNEDVVGWVTVHGSDGTMLVDQPVVRTRDGEAPDWYLSHDVYGRDSRLGCPFLDPRCDDRSLGVVIYGHNMGGDKVFSKLHKAFEQDVFDGIGWMECRLPDGTTRTYHPLFAKSVLEDYQDIQRFDYEDAGQLRVQMGIVSQGATAVSEDLDGRIASIGRAVTLVTCSADRAGQPYRTLVVFGDVG